MSTEAKPTVHLNGTHPRDLLEGYLEARRFIEQAKDAIKKNCPNGRDYYVQKTEVGKQNSLDVAINEHWQRINKLEEVADELMVLAVHVNDSTPENRR